MYARERDIQGERLGQLQAYDQWSGYCKYIVHNYLSIKEEQYYLFILRINTHSVVPGKQTPAGAFREMAASSDFLLFTQNFNAVLL